MAVVKPQTFRMNQSSVAAQTALVEGKAMIAGVDPIEGRRYAIAMTRFYLDESVVLDGWPLEDETQDGYPNTQSGKD